MRNRALLLPLGLVVLCALPLRAAAARIERVEPPVDRVDQGSSHPDLSVDGQLVAFTSGPDVFVLDRKTGERIQVSKGAQGEPPNAACTGPAIAGDGSAVAWVSRASNLAPGNDKQMQAVFRHDRKTGKTRMISVPYDGSPLTRDAHQVRLSGDGCVLAFLSHAPDLVANDTNNARDVFVWDCKTDALEFASVSSTGELARDSSGDYGVDLSRDGNSVVFTSGATNLAPGDTNSAIDVFVRDRARGETVRVSLSSEGTEGNAPSGVPGGVSISGDGQVVAFHSIATNLVPGDTNGLGDIFVHDRKTKKTTRVNVSSDGTQANGESSLPRISDDGRFVAFLSLASNLVPGDDNRCETSPWFARDACGVDLFVHDRQTGTTTRANLSSSGAQMENDAKVTAPEISGNGKVLAFESTSTTLVPGDENDVQDVLLRILAD